MANAYTAVPAIIPGPLQVNGLLTINSDQGIKIGGSLPFVRLYKRAAGFGLSYNLATDEGTRDDAAQAVYSFNSVLNPPAAFTRIDNAAGAQVLHILDETIAQDGNPVANTGNVTENTT